MATERDFELLDDYLSNKMDGSARTQFEQQMASDSGLKNEFGFQQRLVDGVKQARASELKAMLNNIIVPPVQTGATIAKILTFVFIAGTVGTGLYYWVRDVETNQQVQSSQTITTPAVEEIEAPSKETITASPEIKSEESMEATAETQIEQKEIPKKENTQTKALPVKKPALKPYDPTKELDSADPNQDRVTEEISKPSIAASSVQVETDNSNKKLNFHYLFNDNKLLLYGSFEKDLYTILEFFDNNKRTVFLYYNSNYYLLDESKDKPTPLKALTDPSLLKKLREYKTN